MLMKYTSEEYLRIGKQMLVLQTAFKKLMDKIKLFCDNNKKLMNEVKKILNHENRRK